MATHSSILVWKIPWTEEPGELQSMGSKRVGYDLATEQTYTSLPYDKPLPTLCHILPIRVLLRLLLLVSCQTLNPTDLSHDPKYKLSQLFVFFSKFILKLIYSSFSQPNLISSKLLTCPLKCLSPCKRNAFLFDFYN